MKTIYERIQRYGGPEEGGWYYYNLKATNYKENEVEIGLDCYGEGYEIYDEEYFGEHEFLGREIYM